MVGELITLPLRATEFAARLWWRAAGQAASLASDVAGHVIERASPTDSHSREPLAHTPARDVSSVQPAPSPSPPPGPAESQQSIPPQPFPSGETPPPARATDPRPATPTEEPTHVSEEPTLVEEFAEPGAEGGAGPEIHITEPWEGYRHMTAREVTARLSDASSAELAAVQLYESSNRRRQTILAAVARQLSNQSQLGSANGGGSQR